MDKKLLLIRGQHANETAAYEMAPDVARLLGEKGWDVKLEDVDERRTMHWHARQLLAGKKITPHLSLRPGYFRANKDPSLFVFNFHNYLIADGVLSDDMRDFAVSWYCLSIKDINKPQFIKLSSNYDVVELPAVYGGEDNEMKRGLEALESMVKDNKARWYQDAVDAKYCVQVDIPATRKAGLLGDPLKALCAKAIEREAKDYFCCLDAKGKQKQVN